MSQTIDLRAHVEDWQRLQGLLERYAFLLEADPVDWTTANSTARSIAAVAGAIRPSQMIDLRSDIEFHDD
jgi:hypothetical protein